MANKDFVIRLKKTEREGGENLDWVLFPSTNTSMRPSVVEAFDPAKDYAAGSFVNRDGAILKAVVSVKAKRDPFYGSNDDLISETPTPTIDAQTGEIASVFTFPRYAEVDLDISLSATGDAVTEIDVEVYNKTRDEVIGLIELRDLTAVAKTASFSGEYVGMANEEIVLRVNQALVPASFEDINLVGFTGAMDAIDVRGDYVALLNDSRMPFLSGTNDFNMVDISGGANAPDWNQITSLAIDSTNGNVLANAAGVGLYLRDATTGDWSVIPDGNLRTAQQVLIEDNVIYTIDGFGSELWRFEAGTWTNVKGSLVGPVKGTMLNGLPVVLDASDNQLYQYVPDSGFVQFGNITAGNPQVFAGVNTLFGLDGTNKVYFVSADSTVKVYDQDTDLIEDVTTAADGTFGMYFMRNNTAILLDTSAAPKLVQKGIAGYPIEFTAAGAVIGEETITIPTEMTGPEFVAEEWVSAEGYESFVNPHSPFESYEADSVIYDQHGALWYTDKALAAGAFRDQGWTRMNPEDGIEVGYAYVDPNSNVEQATKITGVFCDVERTDKRIPDAVESFWDTTDKYSLFQDTRGTKAVEKPGDEVRFIADQKGNNHIVFDVPGVFGIYGEDENGRGYVNIDNKMETIKVHKSGSGDNYHMRMAVPNVGMLRSDTLDLETGFAIKASKKSNQPICQLALVPDGTDPVVLAELDAEMRRIADRYAFETLTDLNYFFSEPDTKYVFDGDYSFRFITAMRGMYRYAEVPQDISGFDVSKIVDMGEMFEGATGTIDISKWDTSSVQFMDAMFRRMGAFNASIAELDVSSVVTTEGMFEGNTSFNQDISGLAWTKLANARRMFAESTVFDTPIPSLNAPVLNDISGMFESAAVYNQVFSVNLPLLSKAKGVFKSAALMTQAVSITSGVLTDVGEMFAYTPLFNAPVTIAATTLESTQGMFYQAPVFNSTLVIDFSTVKTATEMFTGAEAFDQATGLNPQSLEVANRMFAGAVALTTNPFTSYVFPRLIEGEEMFDGALALAGGVAFAAPNALKLKAMFRGCAALTGPVSFSATIATSLEELFKDCASLNGTVNISARQALDVNQLFMGCASLANDIVVYVPIATSAKSFLKGATAFNNVLQITSTMFTDMSSFFEGCTSYNQPIDIDMAMVEDCTSFLKGATSFNNSVLDVPFNYIKVIDGFLSDCTAFDQDLSSLCVTNHHVQPTDFVTDDVPMAADAAKQPAWGRLCN
ncbi:BspA family leucine-rich repeat surface protein [Vibrio phage C-ZP2022]|nr:BspA family leucine-rich repeat surface protein [Vibrio phage C-ZP2022]